MNSFERLREAVEAAGLQWKETTTGVKANFQTPGHEPGDFGTSITYNGELTLIHCFNGDTEQVLADLGLEKRDLYDNPRGSTYQYPDGFTVSRSPEKYFKQLCKHGMPPTKCRECKSKLGQLYGLQSIKPGMPVYVVEGEKDANTAINVCGVAAVSQAGGANNKPEKADWSPLAGHDVIIVQDDDKPGIKRANNLAEYLQSMPEKPADVLIVKPLEGKDLSDHIAAGKEINELVPVEMSHVPSRSISLESFAGMEWEVPTWGWEPESNGEPHGAIPVGSMSIWAGRPGAGKSTSGRWFAAQVSRGILPGCWYGTPHNVAYIAGEESLKYNVIPSLVAAGADMKRILNPQVSFQAPDGVHEIVPLVPEKDMRELTALLKTKGVKVVVVDPLMEYMGGGNIDIYKNDQVRAKVKPWAKLAEDIDGIVIAIMHLNKSGNGDVVAGINGSSAFGEVARSIFGFAKDPNSEDGDRVMSQEKNSIGNEGAAWTYRIEGKEITNTQGKKGNFGTFVMVGDSEKTVGEVLRELPNDSDSGDRSEVEAIVLDYLESQGGSAKAGDVLKVTRAAGLSDSTVKNSRKKIGVKTVKAGMNGGWVWTIDPASEYFSKVPKVLEGTRSQEPVPSVPSAVPSAATGATDPNLKIVQDTLGTTILGTLSPEYAMSLKTVQGSVSQDQREQVQEILDSLIDQGAVISDAKGRYLLNKKEDAA
ncbi:AAA family ATPase [Corynebacterium stationis]